MSTVVGASGREYVLGDVLQKHRWNSKYNIYKARCKDESFVAKRVPQDFYDRSMTLASQLPEGSHLRMHIDHQKDDHILVYPYMEGTLLDLARDQPELNHIERKKVLRRAAEALQIMHSKNWLHLDIKPDNILFNSIPTSDGTSRVITDAVLADLDLAYQLEPDRSIQAPFPIGNVMWRSPEGQTGKGLTKASDIFSFGLTTLYAMGAGELLLLSNYAELVQHKVPVEDEILSRHFTYFGPVPEALYTRVGDEQSCEWMRKMAEIADFVVERQPGRRFISWGEELGPVAVDLIARMTDLDPTKRPTIEDILAHDWWQRDRWEDAPYQIW